MTLLRFSQLSQVTNGATLGFRTTGKQTDDDDRSRETEREKRHEQIVFAIFFSEHALPPLHYTWLRKKLIPFRTLTNLCVMSSAAGGRKGVVRASSVNPSAQAAYCDLV